MWLASPCTLKGRLNRIIPHHPTNLSSPICEKIIPNQLQDDRFDVILPVLDVKTLESLMQTIHFIYTLKISKKKDFSD
jgi:hypothetical protein